jgi:hypothetical protein
MSDPPQGRSGRAAPVDGAPRAVRDHRLQHRAALLCNVFSVELHCPVSMQLAVVATSLTVADMHQHLGSRGRHTSVDPGPRALQDASSLGPPRGTMHQAHNAHYIVRSAASPIRGSRTVTADSHGRSVATQLPSARRRQQAAASLFRVVCPFGLRQQVVEPRPHLRIGPQHTGSPGDRVPS